MSGGRWHSKLVEGTAPSTKISYVSYAMLGAVVLPYCIVLERIPPYIRRDQRWQTGVITGAIFGMATPLINGIYDAVSFGIYAGFVGTIIFTTVLYSIHLYKLENKMIRGENDC